ncbi:MAG TPA: sulfatase-like hydrolase/transferase [Solirubrobacterales bacterium]|nr:sulfatase-like hydrolase/transferase [Solirubrobacterales bacterium]
MIGRAVVSRSRVAALCVAALACLFTLASTAPDVEAAKKKRLNFLVIQTDDGPRSAYTQKVMPNTFKKIVDKGVRFTEAMTTTPLCCPSRMSLLTGQYSHNHRVTTNFYPKLRGKRNTLPVWLERKGYRTVHVGKFANGYERGRSSDARVAPGWTDWFTNMSKARYFDYDLSVNGKRVHYGSNARAHQTRVVTRRSAGLIRKHFGRKRTRKQPLYLQADYYAPHTGQGGEGRCNGYAAVPLPGDQGVFEGEPLPQPPSFDEQNVSDKPSFVQQTPSLTEESISRLSVRYRCALEALHGVDRGVKKLLKTLRRQRALNDTVVIFLNDNGFFFGEHRLASRLPTDQGGKFEPKVVPYEEAYRVPLYVRAPKRVRGGDRGAATSSAPVANIDIAPTILDLARAVPCRRKGGKDCRLLDGTSFAPLLRGKTSSFPTDRALLVEYKGRGNLPVCVYSGVVTPRTTYVEHTEVRLPEGGCTPADEREHYDLADDPFQLGNLFPAPPGSELEDEQEALEARLDLLRNCAGAPGSTPKPGRALCE